MVDKRENGVSAGRKRLREFNKNYFIVYLLFVEILIFSIIVPKGIFIGIDNIINVLRQSSIVGIIAAGEFLVLLTGAIDLSAGSVVGFTCVMTAKMVVDFGIPVWAAIILGLILGTAVGYLNGLLTTGLHLPPFIVTLGTMEAVRGLTYVVTNAYPVSGLPPEIMVIGRGYIAGIPIPVIIMLVVYLTVYVFAEHTDIGRYIYAIGSNEEASYLSGINVNRIRRIVFSIGSFMASISGIVLLSRLASGQPNGGIGYEFQAITAAVLGGTSTSGGKGKIFGVLVGAIFIAIISNGMVLLDVNSYYQQIVRGAILVVAVAIDTMRGRMVAQN